MKAITLTLIFLLLLAGAGTLIIDRIFFEDKPEGITGETSKDGSIFEDGTIIINKTLNRIRG